MHSNNKIEWENLTETTQRLRVYGGWVVSRKVSKGHTWGDGASDAIALSLVFIPDPNHEWTIAELKNEKEKTNC